MRRFFQAITERNKLTLNKPSDSDVVYYSELNEWYTDNAFRSFSLKYVIDRRIYYKVGKTQHVVNAGNFLLACKQPSVSAYFDSRNAVKSICIDICPATVAEAFTVLTAQGPPDFDNYLSGYFKHPEFFESVCHTATTPLAGKLHQLANAAGKGQAEDLIDKEWFLDLTEKIVFHEYGHYQALNGIRSVKAETKKEVFRRLKIARQYMDEEYLFIEEINQVATACHMSEFHFFRSFKQAFGISPYQYLLGKRLSLAKTLLKGGHMSVTEIAAHCNFPDVFTFSKAFKRLFHVSPSVFAREQ